MLIIKRASPAVLMLIAIALSFVLPRPISALLFYFVVLPFVFYQLYRDGWAPLNDHAFWLIIAVCLWFTLSLAWSVSPYGLEHVHRYLSGGLCSAVFGLACLRCFATEKRPRNLLISVLIIGALVNVCIAFLRSPFISLPDGRMPGWGVSTNLILGANVIGVCVILALGRLLEKGTHRQQLVNAAAVCLGLAFIVATGSRGPLLAVGGAVLLLLFMVKPRALIWFTVLAGLIAILVIQIWPAFLPAIWERLAARGSSYRLEIWTVSVESILRRPLFGHGPLYTFDHPLYRFPHNLFLSTWLYSGVIGFALLLGLFGLALKRTKAAASFTHRWTLRALWLHTILACLTDYAQLTRGPGPYWFVIWMPLLLCIGAESSNGTARPVWSGKLAKAWFGRNQRDLDWMVGKADPPAPTTG